MKSGFGAESKKERQAYKERAKEALAFSRALVAEGGDESPLFFSPGGWKERV